MKKIAAVLLIALISGCSSAPVSKPKACPVKYSKIESYDFVGIIKIADNPKPHTTYNSCL